MHAHLCIFTLVSIRLNGGKKPSFEMDHLSCEATLVGCTDGNGKEGGKGGEKFKNGARDWWKQGECDSE